MGEVKNSDNASAEFRTLDVSLIASAHFIHDVYSSFLSPLLPLLMNKIGFSLSLAGVLTLMQRIPSLLNPFVGLLASRFPLKYFLIVAPSITAISMSLLGTVSSYYALVFLLFVMGVGASFFHVPGPVLIKYFSGERVGKGMSFFMFGGEVARSAGPIVILSAVSFWGLEGSWRVMFLGILASVLLYFRLRNEKFSETFTAKKKETKAKETLKNVLPILLKIAYVTFFISLVKGSLSAFLPTFFTSKGETVWAGGMALSVLQIAGAGGSLFSGTISDKLGRKKTITIILIILPLLLFSFVSTSGVLSFLLLVLLGFAAFSTTPVMLALANEIKSERPAFVNGLYISINFFSGGLAVVLAGYLGDIFGLETTYKIIAVSVFLALPVARKLVHD
jgi:FSR family fosmidomycin resistance protein-like MFS transporter